MGLNSIFLGVRLWLWLYFAISFLVLIGAFMYWFREWIKFKLYKFRFPEKILRVIIHYKSNQYRTYYRVIPDRNTFVIEGKSYNFDDKNIVKNNDFYVDDNIIKIDKKQYKFNEIYGIKARKDSIMEIHYWYNDPSPLQFNFEDNSIEFNSKQLQDFKENDLFAKLLTLAEEKNMLRLLFIISIINLGAIGFVIAKLMEWI